MSTEVKESGPPGAGPDPLIGKEIDGCTIVKKIGQGGMGIVYLAEHSKLKQQYVVKILNPVLTAAEDTVQRFFREAQSVARLNHPSIVGIQNVGQEREYYYIRMEFVDGDTVENIVKDKKKLDWKMATNIVLETAEALSHAHKKGTIHRDIKPENIMLTRNGEVKVMDFGLAKQVQAATKVSVTGQIVGTPFFMSPEQAGGKTVDARSDIYSLGVSYYYMITGVKPFNGKNLQEIFLKHFFYTPESPKIYTPDLPENVCEVIRRCLKKKKKERYQSAAQLARDIRAILEGGELSAPEAADGSDPGASGAEIDIKRGPGSSNVDLAKTSRGLSRTGSEPAIPVGGDTVSRDVAAARAELGADEPGTMVSRPEPTNGSATILAKAVGGQTTAAPAGAPLAPEDASAAPVARRGGAQRVSLTEAQGASLVFQPGGAPFQPKQQGQTATQTPPKGTETDTVNLTGEELIAAQTANAVVKPDAKPAKPAVPTLKRPPSRAKEKMIIGLAGGFLVLCVGGYELLAIIKYPSFEQRYVKLQSAPPGPEDVAGWTNTKQSYDALTDELKSFASTFSFTPKGAPATALADKCAEAAKTAEAARADAKKRKDEAEANEKYRKEVALKIKEYTEKFEGLLSTIKHLVADKKYDEAGKKAAEAYQIAAALPTPRTAEVLCPVQISCDMPSRVYRKGTNDPLADITPTAPALILAPFKDPNFKVEVRRPKFEPWPLEKPVLGFVQDKAILQRAVTGKFSLGKIEPRPCFRNGTFTEPLQACGCMVIDAQEPPTLVVVAHDASLRSYELRSGRPRWTQKQVIGDYGDRLPGPGVCNGQSIVSASPEGIVRAHDVPTGSVVCQAVVGAPVIAAPCVDPGNNFVVVGTIEGDIVALDIRNINNNRIAPELWRAHADGAILTQPAIQGNRVIVGSADTKLRILDSATGKTIAIYDARDSITAGPIAIGNDIIFGTKEGRVHSISIGGAGNVTVNFTTAPAGTEVIALEGKAGKGVFYATKNDVRSVAPGGGGNPIFQPWAPTEDGVPLEVKSMVLMNDAVAVATVNGTVYSLSLKTAEVNWKLSRNTSIPVAPVFDGTDLHLATGEGELLTIPGD